VLGHGEGEIVQSQNMKPIRETEIPGPFRWILEEDLRVVLRSLPDGLAKELTELIGLPATLALLAHYGGLRLYIPRLEPTFRGLRDVRIRRSSRAPITTASASSTA
jgi:hypothetical protein